MKNAGKTLVVLLITMTLFIARAERVQAAVSSGRKIDPRSSYEEQIRLIAASWDVWMETEHANSWRYALSDLDRNGRLEIIASIELGSGSCSYNRIYEVTADGRGVIQCPDALADNGEGPDISNLGFVEYFEDGIHWLVVRNYYRSGWADHYEHISAMALQKGVIVHRPIVSHEDHFIKNEDTGQYVRQDTYYDFRMHPISAEDFKALNYVFEGIPSETVELSWFGFNDDEDDDADLITLLTRSWDGGKE